MFIDKVKKIQTSGSTEFEYYFSLEEGRGTVLPVRVSAATRNRLLEIFQGSNSNFIDLSNPSSVEERYGGIPYQEVMGVLSDILKTSVPGIETRITRNDPVIILRMK